MTMEKALISYGFGKTCELTAGLINALSDLNEACIDRIVEIGGSTEDERKETSRFARAVSTMRQALAHDMATAYHRVFAAEIYERNMHD